MYLSPSEESFQRREFHSQDGDNPFEPPAGKSFTKEEITAYVATCRHNALETLAAETPESLQRESGFYWLPFTRGELHLYNIRHV